MFFPPQRRPIFRHLSFKKWSEHAVFCTFWLTNVLRATAACHFSRSELQKLRWSWGVLYILTCKCAWRHSGVPCFRIGTSKNGVLYIVTCKCASRHSVVPFFISLLNSYLRTRRFSEPTFPTSGTTNHWKNTAICDFPNMWRSLGFFWFVSRPMTWVQCWTDRPAFFWQNSGLICCPPR